MSRFSWALVALILLALSCSPGDSNTTAFAGGDRSASAPLDPGVEFCDRWDAFADFTNEDQEPTAELIAQLRGLQADVDEVVPGQLEREWQALHDWFQPIIDVVERDGYGPVTDETFVAAFGDMEAFDQASERTQAAYETIYIWQDANCPMGDSDQVFCESWPPYAELVNSDPKVDAKLVERVIAMEESLQAVVPDWLEADLAASIAWNELFIDWFQRNGYVELADEDFYDVFDGDEALAGTMIDEQEVAFSNIEAWVDDNCDRGAAAATTALPVQFCEAWDEFVELTAGNAELDEGQVERLREIVDRANADVPAPVADDWFAIADFIDRYGDVLVSVEYQAERITDDMLGQAFGSVGAYDDAVAARDLAGAAIADWSLEGCGGFCVRWPDMDPVAAEVGNWLGWVVDDPEHGPARLEDYQSTMALLDQLAPDEVRDSWELIYKAYLDWIDLSERAGYDPEVLDSMQQSEAVEWARATPYLSARIDAGPNTDFYVRILEAWQAGASEVPLWVYQERYDDFSVDRLDEIREEIEAGDPEYMEIINLFEGDELPWWIGGQVGRPPVELTEPLMNEVQTWVDANCALTTGRPGTLSVLYPRTEGRAGGTAVLALMPIGGSYEDLADVSQAIAQWCDGVGRDPWGFWIEQDEEGNVYEQRWQSEPFRDNPPNASRWCHYQWEREPPRIDAGSYTLVGGITWGSPGEPDVGIDLVSCVETDVVIDSDTIVDLPPFEPCDVRVGGGEPDPWRHPSDTDPFTIGAGTLRIELETMLMPPPYEENNGSLTVVVLPAGSTLNDVGRKQIWPSGAISTQLVGGRHAEEIARQGSVQLPVAALPPGGNPIWLEPDWLAERPADALLPLTTLAQGLYDIHVHVEPHIDATEGEAGPPQLCGRTEALIEGDTVIDMPELGECS